jgi:hypothetical protein
VHPDDERLAKASRALRRRQGIRQVDLSGRGRSRRFVVDLEKGRSGRMRLDDLRDHFAALGATLRTTVWWNGAAFDRLLDERHAAILERALVVMRLEGWRTDSEVTYSKFGERGSIDILAGHDASRVVLVGEVKADIGSLEETNRLLDVKARHAPALALERFGWKAAALGRVLILPEDWTLRRLVARHAATFDSVYPARGREIRTWIRRPSGPLRGLWFVSEVPRRGHDNVH